MIRQIELENAYILEDYYNSAVIKTITMGYHNKTNGLDHIVNFKISYSHEDTKDLFKVEFLGCNKEYFDTFKEAIDFSYLKCKEYIEMCIKDEEEIKKFIEKVNRRKHKKVEE